MKKLLILIVGLFLVAGCANDTNPTGGKDRSFIGGTDSIDFDFMEETPPAEVYDGGQQPFEVTVKLENIGEFDVAKEDIKIKLSGFYPPDFGNPAIEKNPEEDLDKSYIDPDGEEEKGDITFVNFQGFNYVGELKGNNEFTIRADLCYKYGTEAQVDLCVLDDLTSREEEVCEVNENKAVACSSAPIQVENFEEEVAGNEKVKFSFDIVHRGTGLVSKLGSSCDTELVSKNKIDVEVATGLSGLSCSGLEGGETSGTTTLYDGKRKIICMQDLSSVSGNFEKKVNILLKYDYKEHQERNVLVKHATK